VPKVRDAPLSAEAQLAMMPVAQVQAEHFLKALLDRAPVDSRKVWRLAAEFGITRTTLYKVARVLSVEFRSLGRRRLWARPGFAAPDQRGPPYHRLRGALCEALGVLSVCAWDLWGIMRRVLGIIREVLTWPDTRRRRGS